MEDQRDDCRAHAVEDRSDRGQSLESNVQRRERRHDHKVGQDERPTSGPGPPEAAPKIRDPAPDLDGQRPWQRLAHRDALAHLVLGEPLLVAHELALHLPDERDGTSEAEKPEAEVVPDEVADRDAGGLVWVHRSPSRWLLERVT